MDLAKVLPLAFVMIAGPQIISAFFFATSEAWKRESAVYVLGAAFSITAVVTAAYLLANRAKSGGTSSGGVDWGIVVLLVFAMAYVFRSRKNTEPPKWMGKLQTAAPKVAFTLGFLLLGFFPSDVVTSISVGARLGSHGDPWWQAVPFIVLTLLLLAAPALGVLFLGRRAQTLLPKIRNWMNTNSWVVSEIVIVFFIAIVISG